MAGIGNNADQLIDGRIGPTTNQVVVPSLSDATVFTMECPSAEQEFRAARYIRGFHCSADGALSVVIPNNVVPVVFNVKDGTYYPYTVSHFRATDTTITAAQIIGHR